MSKTKEIQELVNVVNRNLGIVYEKVNRTQLNLSDERRVINGLKKARRITADLTQMI